MSYTFYRILHLVSVFGVLLSLGGMTMYMAAGGTKASFKKRKLMAIVHGITIALTLVAGFGLLARLGLTNGLPGWVIAKIVIWLLAGALPALIYKMPRHATLLFLLTWVLAGCAQILALTKPF